MTGADLKSRIRAAMRRPCEFTLVRDRVDMDSASWVWDADLSPIVLLDAPTMERALQQPPGFIDKYLNDPFLGVFPHEVEEADVTLSLMRFELESLSARYPDFDIELSAGWSKKVARYGLRPLSIDEIKRDFTLKKDFGRHEFLAGIAHDMIISRDPESYAAWMSRCYELGL